MAAGARPGEEEMTLEAEAKKRVHVSDVTRTRKKLGGRRQLSIIMEEIPHGNIT